MTLPVFQLLAVLRAGPADSGDVLQALQRHAVPSDVPSIPALYRHLRAALDEGWIEIVGSEAAEDGPGRPRRLYALTTAGRAAVEERAHRLSAFARLAFEGPAGGGGKREEPTGGSS